MTAQARPICKGKNLLAHMITQAKQRVQVVDVMEADCAPQQNQEADVRTGSNRDWAGQAAGPAMSAMPR